MVLPNKFKVYLALILVAVLWGGNNVALKIAADVLPPFLSGVLRFGIAFLFFIPLALYLRTKGEMRWPTWTQWLWLSLLGALGIFFFNFFLFLSLRYTSATEASLLVGFNPLITFLLAWLLLKEEWVWIKFWGIIVALMGVGITLYHPGAGFSHPLGNSLLIFSILAWVGYTLLSKVVMDSQKLNPMETTIYSTAVGTLLLILTTFLVENPLAFLQQFTFHLGVDFLYIGILSTGMAYILWNYGIKEIGAGQTSAFLTLVPPSGVLAAIWILKEPFSFSLVVGMALVVVGIWLTTRENHKNHG